MKDPWGGDVPSKCVPDGRRRERTGHMGRNVTVETKLIILLFLLANKINGIPSGGGSGPGGGGVQKTPLFETYSDWDREVKRTGASGWRVCSINEGYMISTW